MAEHHHHLDHGPFVVKPEKKIKLKDCDAAYTAGFKDKDEAVRALQDDASSLGILQEKLWAGKAYAILILFQGLDASGKDGTIKHVMSEVNPQGCSVVSFKAPSFEEQQHHFLWRPVRHLPPRGHIALFNRSYYEEVLVVRVHPEFLENQWVAPPLKGKPDNAFWEDRFDQINRFETRLVDSGTVVLKFFLHVSREEQRKRFIARLTNQEKLWKFSPRDYEERAYWDDYMRAYEAMLSATSSQAAPWYVIPADHKWFARAAIADIIAARMQDLKLEFPSVSADNRAKYKDILATLNSENAVRVRGNQL